MTTLIPTRAGFALLLVIAVVMVVGALAVAVFASIGAAQADTIAQDADDHLVAGLQQGEALAVRWLTIHAPGVVMPPGGGPLVLVDERLHTIAGDGALEVDLYDGLAGVPAHLLSGSSELRYALPSGLVAVQVPPSPPIGPLQPSGLQESVRLNDGVRRFPTAVGGKPRDWEDPQAPTSRASTPPSLVREYRPSLAEAVSFHSDGPINVNSAPMAMMEQIYHHFHLGGLTELEKNRQRGAFSNAPQGGAKDGLLLVSQSDSWQALVTATWNGRSRSWWVVFAGNPGKMRIVQRHDADG